MNSQVATTDEGIRKEKLIQIDDLNISKLEHKEQILLEKSIIESKFVLPGSDTSKEGAFYDLARSITRRAERSLVKFVEVHKRNDLDYCIKYLNRLSDLLFIYSRSLA
ncbi:MAG: ATP:cob(I)alamin adenosyltransferase [Candidatus Izimaplasma sp.]|nr:ATP:cob(I)alamin adenosyltransferase [Candidatus Izimaplasma bacterium]